MKLLRSRRAQVMVAAGAVMLGTAGLSIGAAYAVSGGGYNSGQQDCPSYSHDWATPNGYNYSGCHNFAVNVESGNTRYAEFGSNQVPNDPNSQGTPGLESVGEPGSSGSPHSGCLAVNTDGTNGGKASKTATNGPEQTQYGCGNNSKGTGFDLNYDYYQYYCPIVDMAGFTCEDQTPGTNSLGIDSGSGIDYQPLLNNGVMLYLGADDNLDNGEHDGLGPYSNKIEPNNQQDVNGPSDGGALIVTITPQNAANTPSASHPEGLANGSLGFCADGICIEATTVQQTVYNGCGTPTPFGTAKCDKGTPKNANVYDYAPNGNPNNDPSVNKESANCNSGDANTTDPQNCGSGGMDAYRSATPTNENAEPGVQLYSDPDAQRSPAAPSPFWPTPALYVGTCGVYAGSPATTGAVLPSNTAITNADGQVAVNPTGC